MRSRRNRSIQTALAGIAGLALALTAVPVALGQGATRVQPQYQQTQQSGQTTGVGQNANPNQVPQQGQQPQLQTPGMPPRGGDLVLGPGDIISLQVADEPDIAGKYLISDSGELSIPTVPNPIHASGLTTTQLSKAIAKGLKDAQILNDPIVSVFVEEYHSHTVTVLGAVVRPGLYPVETHTTVLEVISEAGGLLPSAGSLVTIAKRGTSEATAAATVPQSASSTASPMANGATTNGATVKDASFEKTPVVLPDNPDVKRVDLHLLVTGKDPAANVEVKAGDVVSVGTAPVVYVVGAVTRPGAFAIEGDKSQITVLQALSLVEGLTSVAASSKAVIVRNSADAKNREEIPINISKVMSGKTMDQYLMADDILFIPESGRKKTMQRAGQAAVGAAQYGLGLRVATF